MKQKKPKYPSVEAFQEFYDLMVKEFPSKDAFGSFFGFRTCMYNFDFDPKLAGKRHLCLQTGMWCWKNLLSNPGDFKYYFNRRWDKFWKLNKYAEEVSNYD